MDKFTQAKSRAARSHSGRGPHPAFTLTALWLTGPVRPAAAWRLLAILRSGLSGVLAPAAFRTEAGLAQRRLSLRGDAVVVECLSTGASVELLRRTGQAPRILLRSAATRGAALLTLYGPPLTSLSDVLAFVEFIKQLYEVLHPVAGIVDVVHDSESGSNSTVRASEFAAAVVAQMDQPPPAWLTVLGPERVERVGAARLLMAPVFLIEMLPDGGLLVADTPMPQEDDRGAVRRSTALSDHLQGEGAGLSGVPLRFERRSRPDELVRRGGHRPSQVSEP